MYSYNAVVRSIYDGDTVRLDIDLGCSVWLRNEPVRLFGINAPELRGSEKAAGRSSRDYLKTLIPEGSTVTINTVKDRKGKYGRYLAVIFDGSGRNVNDLLVDDGYAERRDY